MTCLRCGSADVAVAADPDVRVASCRACGFVHTTRLTPVPVRRRKRPRPGSGTPRRDRGRVLRKPDPENLP